MSSTIGFACDHAALDLKTELLTFTKTLRYHAEDLGTHTEQRVDYPQYAFRLAEKIADKTLSRGILICGTGIGMCIAANKVTGIRAAVCSEPYSAKLSRAHNNTNVLCIGARVVGLELAKMIVETWLKTPFEGGRHQDRVNLIDTYK